MSLPVPQAQHFCTTEADAEPFCAASRGTALLLLLHGSRSTPGPLQTPQPNTRRTVYLLSAQKQSL